MLGAGKLRFCCRKIENGRQDDTWYLVMVMGADALYGRMHGVFSSVRNLLSVTVLMCAAFIFALLMAYQRYNDGRAGGLHRCADGRQQLLRLFDEGQQRGGRLHGLL